MVPATLRTLPAGGANTPADGLLLPVSGQLLSIVNRCRYSGCLLPLLLFVAITTGLHARSPFSIAGHSVPAGESRSFSVAVAETEIPFTVFHGVNDGPVLTLTAGIHGDEFPSILALQRLRRSLDAKEISGTVVLVHVANLPGFLGRRIALSPIDGKNLNRVFPGNPNGTLTEKVAHFFTVEVIAKTGYLIDMHSGSAHQELWPHVYSPFVGQPELDARTLEFAKATGMRHIVLYGDRPRDPARSISYPNTAMTRGKPALTMEIGHRGERDEESILHAIDAARGAMLHLKMIPGAPTANEGFTLYRKLHEVESPVTGVFHPRTRIGELVDKGALLAEITNFHGDRIAELRAPVRGIVLMLGYYPPVNRGDAPVTIAEW